MLLPFIIVTAFAAQGQTFDIGEVEMFGQSGLDTSKLSITVHAGDKVSLEHLAQAKADISKEVETAYGKPATDVAVVSFDDKGKTALFVGLPGPTVIATRRESKPAGDEKLPKPGLALYQQDMDRLMPALQAGNLKEDDSQGYALNSDPQMHAIQLKMRDYALHQEAAILHVLFGSRSDDERRAAAMLLSYARRSRRQAKALAKAALDSDEGVRNNATRALGVMVTADKSVRALVPAEQFIRMLSSGTWTDRNKGGWVVEKLTEDRRAPLLAEVRRIALPSLIEMAQWKDNAHAATFRTILGRIAGIEETRLTTLVHSNNFKAILAALK